MNRMTSLFQGALGADLTSWRAQLRDQSILDLQVPYVVFSEILEEASVASLLEHEKGFRTLESVPVIPYGGELEDALGPGVWTDGLHIWVAHSTAAHLRRCELDVPETTDTLRHGLMKTAAFLRAVRQSADEGTLSETTMASEAQRRGVDFREWSEVRARLRAFPILDALVSSWPESEWSSAEVRGFQKTLPANQPALEGLFAAVAASPLASQVSGIGALEEIPTFSAAGARIGQWLTDHVERRVSAASPDAMEYLAMWTVQWGAPRLGAVARLAKAMEGLPEKTRKAYREDKEARRARRQLVLEKCGEPAYEACWRMEGGHPPHEYSVYSALGYDDGVRGWKWARVTAALLDSTPQTEEEDLARWYRAFLEREWRSARQQNPWSSLAPADPAWRGAARWWDSAIKKEGFRFLVAQGQPVSETSQLGTGTMPPLHRAMLSSDGPLVEKLLAQGAQVDAADAKGETALFVAPAGALTQRLLDAGADVNHRARTGATALHAAFREKEKNLSPEEWKVTHLLAAGADPTLTTRTGRTALHSLMTSDVEPHGAARLQILLDAGIDSMTLDSKGRCALTLAWQQEPCAWKKNWFAQWMAHPSLQAGQLPFAEARALHKRLKAHQPGVEEYADPDKPTYRTQLDAWWTAHRDLHRLEGVMPAGSAAQPRRNRM